MPGHGQGIVCLTLAKWETVFGQFGGYRSWSFRANSTHNRFGRLRSALTAIRSPRLGRRRATPKWYARFAIRRICTLDSGDHTIVDIPIVFADEATRIRTSRCELRRPGLLA
jgi:hypothetical protein